MQLVISLLSGNLLAHLKPTASLNVQLFCAKGWIRATLFLRLSVDESSIHYFCILIKTIKYQYEEELQIELIQVKLANTEYRGEH